MARMMNAPIEELVHYLAIFHRACTAFEAFGERADAVGMLMAGHLADALHNVPSMLVKYEDGFHSPSSIRAFLKKFPGHLRRMMAPEHLVAACRDILAAKNDAKDLGLAKDLRDVDPAPPKKMKAYLKELEDFCLGMRAYPSFFHGHDFTASCSDKASDAAVLLGLSAAAMKPLPSGLLHFARFDEAAFRAGVESYAKRLPPENYFSEAARRSRGGA